MALTTKQEAFARAVANGDNASDAYRSAYDTARMSSKTINEAASRLLANSKVSARIAELKGPALEAASLSVERTLRSCAAVAYQDPRRFYNADGSFKPVAEWDDDMAACVASIETKELFDDDGKLKGCIRKLKFWNRNEATSMAMKYLGAFEHDNRQRAPNLALQVNLIQTPPAQPNVAMHVNRLEGKTLAQEDVVVSRAGTRDPSPSHKGTIDGNQERAAGARHQAHARSEGDTRQVLGLFRRQPR
jgi:phage terminase small subunit